MKRSWTPSPWKPWNIDELYNRMNIYSEEDKANGLLKLKAPDMAEILIRLVDPATLSSKEKMASLLSDAIDILKELGCIR